MLKARHLLEFKFGWKKNEMEMDDFELEDKEEHLKQKIDAVDYQLRNPA